MHHWQAGHNERGRLRARPNEASGDVDAPRGLQTLDLEAGRGALLYVPARYDAAQPAPLALLLHGAGGEASHSITLAQSYADALGIVLLAPASLWRTWDVIESNYGPDVARIDLLLTQVFARYMIDAAQLAIGGFSDGASYALSLGITNGDLFSHILAFSPGFSSPATQIGTPRVFISHGTDDRVLPINRCSRQIVPRLLHAGYDVTYEEFHGPHTVPPDIAQQGFVWFVTSANV